MQNTLRHIVRNRDLAAVTVGNLVLYLFYVWAPLYVPVYLHDVLGFPWTSLGLIFSVMLIPYVIVEYPAGWIADRYLGDKELMFGGFLIAGASLAALSVVTATTPLVVILIILTISRVGSALTESMVEAHFFRRVSKRDINSVSVYRSVWPLSYIIAPIIGGFLLIHGGYHTFFLVTGALVMAGGGIATLLIKDFR
jgi:MFS family permease